MRADERLSGCVTRHVLLLIARFTPASPGSATAVDYDDDVETPTTGDKGAW
jgi:hypothetical protein